MGVNVRKRTKGTEADDDNMAVFSNPLPLEMLFISKTTTGWLFWHMKKGKGELSLHLKSSVGLYRTSQPETDINKGMTWKAQQSYCQFESSVHLVWWESGLWRELHVRGRRIVATSSRCMPPCTGQTRGGTCLHWNIFEYVPEHWATFWNLCLSLRQQGGHGLDSGSSTPKRHFGNTECSFHHPPFHSLHNVTF